MRVCGRCLEGNCGITIWVAVGLWDACCHEALMEMVLPLSKVRAEILVVGSWMDGAEGCGSLFMKVRWQ